MFSISVRRLPEKLCLKCYFGSTHVKCCDTFQRVRAKSAKRFLSTDLRDKRVQKGGCCFVVSWLEVSRCFDDRCSWDRKKLRDFFRWLRRRRWRWGHRR